MTSQEQRQVAEDDPLMIAWKAYQQTDAFANANKWAAHEQHLKGSLWAVFESGFRAGGKTVHEANGQALFAFDQRDKADLLLRDAIDRRKSLENLAGTMAYALKHGRPWCDAIDHQYREAMLFERHLVANPQNDEGQR